MVMFLGCLKFVLSCFITSFCVVGMISHDVSNDPVSLNIFQRKTYKFENGHMITIDITFLSLVTQRAIITFIIIHHHQAVQQLLNNATFQLHRQLR